MSGMVKDQTVGSNEVNKEMSIYPLKNKIVKSGNLTSKLDL